MKIINITSSSDIEQIDEPLIIDGFDIIHKGHMELFNETTPNNFCALIVTNIPRKKQIFNSIKDRIENIKKLFPKTIYVFDLSKENIPAFDFVDKILLKMSPKQVIVRFGFQFGSDCRYARDILPQYFHTIIVSENSDYQTSLIVNLYQNGEVAKARDLLCFPIYIKGVVEQGNKLGRAIGFPTLNFKIDTEKFINYKPGVYAANTYIHDKLFKSALYVSEVEKGKQLFESHIIDPFSFTNEKQNIGNKIKIELLKYINELKNNKNINDLKKCVQTNVSLVKKFFAKEKII